MKARERRITTMRQIELESKLPEFICGNLRVSCGKRRGNKACRTKLCAYNMATRNLPIQELEILAVYVRS